MLFVYISALVHVIPCGMEQANRSKMNMPLPIHNLWTAIIRVMSLQPFPKKFNVTNFDDEIESHCI